jgi:hypothetical protein
MRAVVNRGFGHPQLVEKCQQTTVTLVFTTTSTQTSNLGISAIQRPPEHVPDSRHVEDKYPANALENSGAA